MSVDTVTKDLESAEVSGSTLNDLLPDVFLSNKSLEYIKSVFGGYTKTNTLPSVVENVVIHMYPKEDTTPNDEDVNGYMDAIFAKVKIYMPKIKKVFIVQRLCDAIFVEKGSNVRIFKDGSTCISVDGKLNISIGREIRVGLLTDNNPTNRKED